MGVVTLLERQYQTELRLINPCLKMGSPATYRAFILLSGGIKMWAQNQNPMTIFLLAIVTDNQKDTGGQNRDV